MLLLRNGTRILSGGGMMLKTGHGYGVGCASEEEALEEAKRWPYCLFIDVYERVDPHEYKPVHVRKICVCKTTKTKRA